MSFVSYAQNGEDVLLHRVFGGQETGFYVDVGAYHPVEGSVTKAFYDRGWSGINVEPGAVFDELAAARPRDINLRMAVLDRTGMALLQENAADPGTSHVIEDSTAAAVLGTREVPCDTLENLVGQHGGGRPVDFLKVDAEGAEGAIVACTDWRRFRPRVLVFEATLPWSSVLSNGEWELGLLQGGYVRAYFDGINCFYVPEEEQPLLERHFHVPINVLDRVERFDAAALAARDEAAAVAAQLAETRAALVAVQAAYDADQEASQAQLDAFRAAQAAAEAAREQARHEAATASEQVAVFRAAQAAAEAAREQARHEAATASEQVAVFRAAQAAAEAAREQARHEAALTVGQLVEARAAQVTAETIREQAQHAAAVAEAQKAELQSGIAAVRMENAEAEERLRSELATARADNERLTRLIAESLAQIAAVREVSAVSADASIDSPVNVLVAVPGPRAPRYRIVRRLTRAAYQVVRPIVRPVMHRVRTFLTVQQIQLLEAIRHEILGVRSDLVQPRSSVVLPPQLPPPPPEIHVVAAPADLAEIRRLAVEVERAVLTLAMEAQPPRMFADAAP